MFGDMLNKVYMLLASDDTKAKAHGIVLGLAEGESLTEQDYKEALNAAMLYAQSVVADSANGLNEPSPRSTSLLQELTTIHADTIRSVAIELNPPALFAMNFSPPK